MKKIEKIVLSRELTDLVMEMNKDLLFNITEFETVELEEIGNIFKYYYNECEKIAETVEATYLETDKEYIEHYQKQLKALEQEKENLKSKIDFYRNKQNLK